MRYVKSGILCSAVVFALLSIQVPVDLQAADTTAIQSSNEIAATQTRSRLKTQSRSKTGTCIQTSSIEQQPIYLAGKGKGKGYGPGDGTGNGGVGPKNGTGYGSKTGTCPYSS